MGIHFKASGVIEVYGGSDGEAVFVSEIECLV